MEKKLKARNKSNKLDKYIRDFSLPATNSNAYDYYLMIDWRTKRITEPPATRALNKVDINHCIYEKQVISCSKYPCHTQPVERTMNLVTESSSRACIQFAREGIIISTYSLPEFKSKKYLVPIK